MEPTCITLTRYFYTPLERSDLVLREQLVEAESIIGALIQHPLLPYQQDALVCLVSDLVSGLSESIVPTEPFYQSFLVRSLNKGMIQIAAGEFCLFCYDQHGKIPVKNWNKRRAEQHLFTSGKLWFN